MAYQVIENPNPSKYVFPAGSDAFLVVDENGKADATFSTLEQAQKRADALNTPCETYDDDFGFFDDETAIDYFGGASTDVSEPVVEVSEEEAKETTGFVTDNAYKVGDIIREGKYQYRVAEDSFYVSAKDAAEINEAFDAADEVGWHTSVRLVS